jgi:hypothetical protein
MKFSTGLSPGTFARSAAFSAMLLALLSIACAISYASTTSPTLRTDRTSRTSYSERWTNHSRTAGPAQSLAPPFATSPDRLTNSIDLKISRLSAEKSHRSPSSSAGPIESQLSSSKISITFTSQSLRTIRANRYGSFSPIDTSPTVLRYLAARPQRSWQISDESPATV